MLANLGMLVSKGFVLEPLKKMVQKFVGQEHVVANLIKSLQRNFKALSREFQLKEEDIVPNLAQKIRHEQILILEILFKIATNQDKPDQPLVTLQDFSEFLVFLSQTGGFEG
jgi:hypothetical protein